MKHVILILIMVTVWGLLTKSLTDSETIEEMVDRKIAEHEENPESHMGVGESIDVHRKNTIIDHPLGSVLSDKQSMTEILHRVLYTDDTIESVTGTAHMISGSFMNIYDNGGDGTGSKIYRGIPYTTIPENGKDYLYQVAFAMYPNATTDYLFLHGLSASIYASTPHLYLEVSGTTGKIKSIMYGHTFESDTFTVSANVSHIFRIQYIAGEEKLKFFIDGTIVYEYSISDITVLTAYYIMTTLKDNSSDAEIEVPISSEFVSKQI